MALQAKEAAFVRLMDATEAYMSAIQTLEEATKKGLFHISQARYGFQGPMGQAQWPSEMEASTTVSVSGSAIESESPHTQVRANTACSSHSDSCFSLQASLQPRTTGSQAGSLQSSNSAVKSVADSQHNQQGQQGPGEDSSANPEVVDGNVSHNKSGNNAKQTINSKADPVRWYGVLVPPALRQAQSQFLEALHLVVKAANARQQLQQALAAQEELSLCDDNSDQESNA